MGIERCKHGRVIHVTEERGDGSINDEDFPCESCVLEAEITSWPDVATIDIGAAMKRLRGKANPAEVARILASRQ